MKPFTKIVVILLAILCLVHVARLIMGWSVRVNNLDIPLWVSIIGALVAGFLSIMLWKENK
jgi:uncharacterized integral membrane protein